ncbi:hypothetical protein [Parvicella tangerina]|uniref:DoxX family protein n=1 Tax=Parvicella tangerina TaxID=2829795 RepID=A0A916JM94_9FLAO|nr:hypothetical protein [Parvicella tangerina]CAG5081584.1 hypothetical protein CRYO30217_01676 [Parvicella tangerina]
MDSKQLNRVEYVLRIAVFGVFLGHGVFAYTVKEHWISYLEAVGFSYESAIDIMPFIGLLDFAVAAIVLIYPIRLVVLWAMIWALATATVRPISGEPIWDFVERAANWGAPLALLIVLGFPKRFAKWFSPRTKLE